MRPAVGRVGAIHQELAQLREENDQLRRRADLAESEVCARDETIAELTLERDCLAHQLYVRAMLARRR